MKFLYFVTISLLLNSCAGLGTSAEDCKDGKTAVKFFTGTGQGGLCGQKIHRNIVLYYEVNGMPMDTVALSNGNVNTGSWVGKAINHTGINHYQITGERQRIINGDTCGFINYTWDVTAPQGCYFSEIKQNWHTSNSTIFCATPFVQDANATADKQ